ncbi:MAG: putative hydrolase of the HAD superfamily [Candidatus Poriferisodalaceae bacterium]
MHDQKVPEQKVLDGVLFDFDGVIRQWDEPDLMTFEAEAGFEIGTVFEVAFHPDVNHPVIRGDRTWEQWRAMVLDRLTDTHGEHIEPVVHRFFEFEGRIDPHMVELLEALRGQVRIGLLTNNHDRFEAYLERVGLTGHFDVVVNTHRIGAAKPDPRAYHLALGALGVSAERCLFTDDLERNTQGATEAGLHAHHFVGQTGLEAALSELSIRAY